VGIAIIAYALVGLLRGAPAGITATKPVLWAVWILGVAIAHDLVVAPLTMGVGKVLRLAPASIRRSLQAALTVSAIVTVVAIPLLRASGRPSSNPTLVPRDPVRDWLVLLVVIWALAVVNLLRRAWLHRRA
jgi:divalent metal cation (Fe/Co/Zn/Cd) transporter